MPNLAIEQRRGFATEAVHAVDAVSCDGAGQVRILSGQDATTTFRSASKPFQLEIAVELLSEAGRLGLSASDLALGAASHHGEPFHIEALRRLLSKLQITESDLYCGAHPPLSAAGAQGLWARGEPPSVLHNNCAGKHAFMAAAAREQGWPGDYRPADHPLQRAILERLQRHTGYGVSGAVVDGCGVPCFVLGLSSMARAWAALARETRQRGPSALSAIGRAIRAHPLLVSGSEAFDGWLMQHTSAIAKVGAAALLCIAIPERGLGLAIKVRTGGEPARPVAAAALLARYVPGLLRAALPERHRVVHNVMGAAVGEIVAHFDDA